MISFDPWSSPYFYHETRPFVGAAPNDLPAKLTASVAPVIAPGAGGFTARLKLDDKQRLHAAMYVDGKCYNGSIDLAAAIAILLTKLAQYHTHLHAAMPPQGPVVSGDAMLSAVDRLVTAAGDSLINQLSSRHAAVACAGWLDDIGDAVKGAGTSVFHGVQTTVQKLKAPITAAAVTYATSWGGPAAGEAASQLVGPIIDSAANLGKDTPAKAAAEQQAKTDPATAQALAIAKGAAAHTIAAYHVVETAQQAAAGNPVAQQQVVQVVQDAKKGDPVASAVAPLIQHSFSGVAARHHRRRHPREQDPALSQEIYQRFWTQTHYNPGRMLNPQVTADAQMIPAWHAIAAQVQREHGGQATVRGW